MLNHAKEPNEVKHRGEIGYQAVLSTKNMP